MNLKEKFNIEDLVYEANIATLLSKEDLTTIGVQIVRDFDSDLNSRSSWEKRTEASLKLALQVAETKNFPWANASNVKFPLITIAALQYHKTPSHGGFASGGITPGCAASHAR
jgi:hypothetical protein